MRTLSKDLLMICKLWYDSDNNKSIVDALSKYIEQYTECEPGTDTLNYFLGNAVKRLIDVSSLVNTLNERSESFVHRDQISKLFLLHTYISLLQGREVTAIDLTDYDKIEEYVKNPVVKEKEWWDYFNDAVEDDRD